MRFIIALILGLVSTTFGQIGSPFSVSIDVEDQTLAVQVEVPDAHYLYVDHFEVTQGAGRTLSLQNSPETVAIKDPVTGKSKGVYAASFVARYPLESAEPVTVSYLGCNDQTCFLPQSETFELAGTPSASASVAVASSPDAAPDLDAIVDQLEVKSIGVGYKNTEDFLALLDRAEGQAQTDTGFALFLSDPVAYVDQSGLLVAILFILLGGLALNLTPCVLPMIPINLAIIGAGAQAGSKSRGFALGAVYGLGIALVYGILGVVVVLSGSQFGTLQSSPWFSFSIAAIFAVLGLAMFDVLNIDFSSLQNRLGSGPKKSGSFWVALSMGSVAALLAGACVAPVVIAVLLLAASLYEVSPVAGLALPFVLGLGMALPWPFAGAGLSFLPKPGQWMVRVKQGFGVLILLFALYYLNLGIKGFRTPQAGSHADGSHITIDGATNEGLAEVLREARDSNTPVMIDFGASWCKNCEVMEATTFKNDEVIERLSGYRVIRYLAEDPTHPTTKAFMERFQVRGLPTYVVLGN
jgi:thiol:disulfide interchange protein